MRLQPITNGQAMIVCLVVLAVSAVACVKVILDAKDSWKRGEKGNFVKQVFNSLRLVVLIVLIANLM